MQVATRFTNSTKCLNYCRRLACRNLLPSLSSHAAVQHHFSHGYSSAAPDILPPPASNSAQKVYPPKIQKLVDDISLLTLIEVADLNELLKKTLNIQDAPMMAMGAAPVAALKEDEEDAPKREKVSFTVRLINFDGSKKVPLIKEIKNVIEGLNLVQAKKFVESLPQVVKADITKEEADKLKELLAAAGAEVVID